MAYKGTALRKDSAFLRLSLYLTLTHKHATPHQWQTGTGIKNILPADWHWQPVKVLPGSQRTHFAISPGCTILKQNASWEMILTENQRQTLIYPRLLRGIIKTFISLCFVLLPAIPVFALHVCFQYEAQRHSCCLPENNTNFNPVQSNQSVESCSDKSVNINQQLIQHVHICFHPLKSSMRRTKEHVHVLGLFFLRN